MSLRINDTIPDLTVETDHGSMSLHGFVGDSWAILFSHPKDFTPVCTTEFGAVAQLRYQRHSTCCPQKRICLMGAHLRTVQQCGLCSSSDLTNNSSLA